jgi:hypothetical protein
MAQQAGGKRSGRAWTSAEHLRAAAAREPTEAPPGLALGPERDVFLSHSYADRHLVPGVRRLIEEKGYSAYVDWIDDKEELDRANVTPETADKLRSRMRRCRCLLFVVSDSSPGSAWMPWELGFFDGHNGKVGVFPVRESDGSGFAGQEYLDLYPTVTAETLEEFLGKSAAREAPWLANPERMRAGAVTLAAAPQMAMMDPWALHKEWMAYWTGVWQEFARMMNGGRAP